jgi:O-antigen ligase
VTQSAPLRWRPWPHTWRAILRAPVTVALAPLAWALAVVNTAVKRPSLAVGATVLLVCLPSDVQDVSTSGHITSADVAAGGVIVLIAIRLFAGDRVATPRGWLPYAAAVASFALATITATDVGASARGFVRYTELFVLVPVATALAIRDRRDVFIVAGAIVATTGFEGAVGVYQTLTGTGASYAGRYVRAVGTFGAEQVLAMGALIGYGLLVTLALGLAVRGRARVALLALSGLLTVPLALSLSRGAWIATACAVFLMLVVFSWRVAVAVAGTAVVAVLVLSLGGGASGPAFGERVTSIVSSGSEPDRSVRDRYALWSTAVDMWADHPVFGVGMKDFVEYRDSYAPMGLSAGSDVDDPAAGYRKEPLLSAHNQYLMVLSEQGTVGILAFGGLLATLAVGAVRRRRPENPVPRFFDLVAPALMLWTLIDFTYGDVGAGPTGVLLGILLGLVARRAVIVPVAGQDATGRGES